MPTILLVDDEDLVREELGGLLEDEGYEVMTASNGQEALEVFRTRRPDMVITDAKMPKLEGLALARELLSIDPAVPITMVTGHGSEAMAIEALRVGITDFIKKPVQIEDLLSALERMKEALGPAEPLEMAGLPPSARLVSRGFGYELRNDIADVPAFVRAVLRDLAPDLPARRREALQLALRELLINAIEHGNFGVSYDEKSEATEMGTLDQLIDERSSQLDLAERLVRVEATRTRERLTISVEDEGEGFDWRSLPDPTDPDNLLKAHGRGVLLATLSVDVLEYNEKGNKVTVIVNLGDSQGGEGSQ